MLRVEARAVDHGDGLNGIGLHDFGLGQRLAAARSARIAATGARPGSSGLPPTVAPPRIARPLPCAIRSETTRQTAAASAATAAVAAVMLPVRTGARAKSPGPRSRGNASCVTPFRGTISAPRSAASALAWLSAAQASCRSRGMPRRLRQGLGGLGHVRVAVGPGGERGLIVRHRRPAVRVGRKPQGAAGVAFDAPGQHDVCGTASRPAPSPAGSHPARPRIAGRWSAPRHARAGPRQAPRGGRGCRPRQGRWRG